jgi:hypothetical protein
VGCYAVSEGRQIQFYPDPVAYPRTIFGSTTVETSKLSSAPYFVSRSKILVLACGLKPKLTRK